MEDNIEPMSVLFIGAAFVFVFLFACVIGAKVLCGTSRVCFALNMCLHYVVEFYCRLFLLHSLCACCGLFLLFPHLTICDHALNTLFCHLFVMAL